MVSTIGAYAIPKKGSVAYVPWKPLAQGHEIGKKKESDRVGEDVIWGLWYSLFLTEALLDTICLTSD